MEMPDNMRESGGRLENPEESLLASFEADISESTLKKRECHLQGGI